MVNYTQNIYRQFDNKLFECVWPVCEMQFRVKISCETLVEINLFNIFKPLIV